MDKRQILGREWGGVLAGGTPQQVTPHPHMGSTKWSPWVLRFKSEDTKSEGRKVTMGLGGAGGQR